MYSIPNLKTLVFIYSGENITHGKISHKNDFDIMDKFMNNVRPTVYLIHSNNCHYEYLEINKN